MLHLAIVFLVIAFIAAFFGFVGVAALSWGRGEDTLRYLPRSRGAVFSGARIQRTVLQGVTGLRLSPDIPGSATTTTRYQNHWCSDRLGEAPYSAPSSQNCISRWLKIKRPPGCLIADHPGDSRR